MLEYTVWRKRSHLLNILNVIDAFNVRLFIVFLEAIVIYTLHIEAAP